MAKKQTRTRGQTRERIYPGELYPDVPSNPDLPALEAGVLEFWKTEKLFRASVRARPAKRSNGQTNEFIFFDGPPFANGLPHYGHLLTGFVKDAVARYHTMRGRRVERRFGWDCHGLPAEMSSEKELGISGRQAIINFGIENFNAHCRQSVMKYTQEWESYVTRQGRWVDFENDYKTMDTPFMESVLWAFKQLHEKGLVYEAHRVMPYSWAAETPLSNFETRLDNSTREREDKAITVAFELKEKPPGAPDAEKYYILAWTTTPWTLPSNLALGVGNEVEYVCVTKSSPLAGEHDAPFRVGGGKTDFATEKAQEMRKTPTDAEKKLWHLLSQNQLGYKFRRQQPMGKFIVDFYSAEKRLVIELDGGQHADNANDEARTQWLKSQGLKILRFWNHDVLENADGVLATIADTLKNTPHAVSSETAAPPQGGSGNTCYILAASALPRYAKEFGIEENQALQHVRGDSLIGLSYKPLFPYFKDHKNAFKILDGSSFVTDSDGTGVVHLAPGFGEDDQKCCEENGIELVVPVDEKGRYTDAIFDLPDLQLKGLNVIAQTTGATANEPYKEDQLKKFGLANLRIIKWLKEHGQLIKEDQFLHNYPHCWRTDQPLIYRAMPSWYVEVTKFRDRMVHLNQQIHWVPEHIRDGLFGKWLEGARDWSISRNRFWGTPIPVWRREDAGVGRQDSDIKVFGSIAEMEAFFDLDASINASLNPESRIPNPKITDLHRPFIDTLTIAKDGSRWKRVEDVFDCWFESGSMPYAQVHYPFENKDWFEQHFPADFIVEYQAQTRGWFYTLMVLSTALFDKPPFLNCICHGVVLDDKGQKLSKRLNNYADPMELFDKFGADSLRWFMLSSPVMRGAEMHIDKEGKFIRDVVRLAIKPVWNAYHFFCLYANADKVEAELLYTLTNGFDHWRMPMQPMDRYILSKLATCVLEVASALDELDFPKACMEATGFIENLNNWYIRRTKPRFWKEQMDDDKQDAYDTLYTCLHMLARVLAPLLPFTAEEMYAGLVSQGRKRPETSVHLAEFPLYPNLNTLLDPQIMQDMDRIREICNAALSVRNSANLRVRLPLSRLTVVGEDETYADEYEDIIRDEINVRQVTRAHDVATYATRKLQVNFPKIGARLGAKTKEIIPAIKAGKWELLADESVQVCGEILERDECTLLLEALPQFKAQTQTLPTQDALVVLDTTVTPELEREGLARDIIRAIQQARKDAGLDVSDRIELFLDMPPKAAAAVKEHKNYIATQTLAAHIVHGAPIDVRYQTEIELDDIRLTLGFSIVK